MVDRTTDLDRHRGLAAQKATEIRRRRVEVESDQAALRARRQELEKYLLAAPAEGWPEAVEKARYLLGLFAETAAAEDPRRQTLIASVLEDFDQAWGVGGAIAARAFAGAGFASGCITQSWKLSRAIAASIVLREKPCGGLASGLTTPIGSHGPYFSGSLSPAGSPEKARRSAFALDLNIKIRIRSDLSRAATAAAETTPELGRS
jgi:hypothetical protein